MGIVLNRPADAPARELLPALEDVAGDDPLFIGGPVQPQAVAAERQVVIGPFEERREQ